MSDISSQSNWRIEQDAEGVAWLCFDKAGASTNVLSGSIMQELGQRIAELEKLKPKGVVIYSGKKSGFIAGADIKEFTTLKTPDEAFKLIRGGQLVLEQLEKLPCPTAALIQGFCLGGGLELSLACSYRVGVDDDKLNLGLPEVKLGIHPGFGGTVRSARLVGVLPAMSFMLSGRSVHGREAAKIGLIDALVKEVDAKATAKKLVLTGHPKKQAPFLQKLLALAPLRPFIANVLTKQVASKVRRDHYPAPYAVIDLWKRHASGEQAYVQEAHSIASLMLNDTSHNLVRVFLLTDRLKSLGKKSDLDLKHVHVVGAGTMGGDIAAWCALRGFTVTLQDREEKYIQPAMARAQKLFEKKLKGAEVQNAIGRLKMDVAGDGAKDAQVAIEAIFEDVTAKQDLLQEARCRDGSRRDPRHQHLQHPLGDPAHGAEAADAPRGPALLQPGGQDALGGSDPRRRHPQGSGGQGPRLHPPHRQVGGACEECSRFPGEPHPHAVSHGSHAGGR